MLSGFVMARTYERRMAEGLSPLSFLKIRTRRLWPLLVLAALIGFAAVGGAPWQVVVLSLLCIPILWGPAIYPLNAPQWSIFFEVIANALHVTVLYRLTFRHLGLIWLAAFIVLAAYAYRDGHVAFGSTAEQFVGGFPRVIVSYVLGIILWRLWGDRAPFTLPPVATALIMPLSALLPLLWGTYWLYDLAFVALVNPLLLAGGLSWKAGRAGEVLGAASYPVYILHIPVLLLAEQTNFVLLFAAPFVFLLAYAVTAKRSMIGS